ncbi:MAG: 30S ribosome-binding factor RbfA [Candidatus Omnitrophota bacterium]
MPRYERVAEAIRREVGVILQEELNDPRLGFVTITQVEMTPDLKYAKVFFSVLGSDEQRAKTKSALDSSLGFIRRLIAQRIRLRFTPEISFYEDRSAEYSVRIEEALGEIHRLKESEAPCIKPDKPKRKRKKSEPKKSRRPHKKA